MELNYSYKKIKIINLNKNKSKVVHRESFCYNLNRLEVGNKFFWN